MMNSGGILESDLWNAECFYFYKISQVQDLELITEKLNDG